MTQAGTLAGYPKTLKCKEGTSIVVRPLEAQDRDAVHDFLMNLPRADRLFLRRDEADPGVLERWIASLDYAKRIPLLATSADAIAGYALLDGEQPAWSSHVAEIRVVVGDAFKKRSIGTLLARELVDLASDRTYEKLVAQMMENQVPARRMFERMGFAVEAELKGHVKDLEGAKHNLLVMTCSLDDAWHHMEELLQDFAPWAE